MKILLLTTAETDLLTFSRALEENAVEGVELKSRSVLRLKQRDPLEEPLRELCGWADLALVRLIGGREYFPAGSETLEEAARRGSVEVVAVSAAHQPEPDLTSLSTQPDRLVRRVETCLLRGGTENARRVLRMLEAGGEPLLEPHRPPMVGRSETLSHEPDPGSPTVALLYYRANQLCGDVDFVEGIAEPFRGAGWNVRALYVQGLRDEQLLERLVRDQLLDDAGEPAVEAVVSLLGFCASDFEQPPPLLRRLDVPWIQGVVSKNDLRAWKQGTEALDPADLSMKVIFPEFDGRLHGPLAGYKSSPEDDERIGGRVRRTSVHPPGARSIQRWIEGFHRLRTTRPDERRVAIVLGNHPTSRARVGNGVGLDTPASLTSLLEYLKGQGYRTGTLPEDGQALFERLIRGGTFTEGNRPPKKPAGRASFEQYRGWLSRLPGPARERLRDRWGDPAVDPRSTSRGFPIPGLRVGNLYLGVQPPRGFDQDPDAVYHDPELPPPHSYVAFYRWLTRRFEADALIHLGKHGTLEWLPGRNVAPSVADWPWLLIDEVPLVYPFIINDPGEGSQAKRRAGATIVDHLVAPQRRTGLPEELKPLDELLARRRSEGDSGRLKEKIRDRLERSGLIEELDGVEGLEEESLRRLRTHLEDLRDSATRSGLHVLGELPEGEQRVDLLESLWPAEESPRPDRAALEEALEDPGHAPERLRERILPDLERTSEELIHVGRALEGGHVPPGPSGSPTRGRPDLLPTGRNFYSRDARGMPTRAAWRTGKRLAEELISRHREDTGEVPARVGVILWGTSNMRTGGEDVAQVLALLGVKPEWSSSGRVHGLERIDAEELGRPRIDPFVRISGFFRDAFPHLVDLIARAVQMARETPEEKNVNYVRQHDAKYGEELPRVYGSKPGCYGAGLLPLIENQNWSDREDLAEVFMTWGQYAYGGGRDGQPMRGEMEVQLGDLGAVTQNRDTREHDLFDSDDYFQFHGGLIAAAEVCSGTRPRAYCSDTSRPGEVRVRSLSEECSRVFRSRVSHPTWQEGMRQHGYKGGFEMAATLDYVFGYDAATEVVPDRFYKQMAEDFLLDEDNRDFLEKHNRWALRDLGERFLEADQRDLWENPSPELIDRVRGVLRETESPREEAMTP